MNKIINDNEIDKLPEGKRVVVGGCFDVLHDAHIEFLKLSKNEGEILIVMLESDENIKKLKGPDRPLNNQVTRAENLSKIEFVDFIILLKLPESLDYYYNLVKLIAPDIIAVTDGDPQMFHKNEQARITGGKVVVVMERNKKFSTTQIVNK